MMHTALAPRPVDVPAPAPAPARPRWQWPALGALLVATAALYLWGLSASGWANAYYSAAAQAGSASWKAFFFGSFDAANSITVDKPPASLWLMALSVRVFGLSSWTILVPQALCGVAAVGAALRGRAAVVRAGRRAARRRGAGAHPGGGADVPLQQPGRAAGAAAGGRRVRDRPGGREGAAPGGWCWPAPGRLRLPDQDAAGVPGGAGVRAGVPGRRARPAVAAGRGSCCSPALAMVVRPAGGSRSSSWCRRRAARTSAARRTTASWS